MIKTLAIARRVRGIGKGLGFKAKWGNRISLHVLSLEDV